MGVEICFKRQMMTTTTIVCGFFFLFFGGCVGDILCGWVRVRRGECGGLAPGEEKRVHSQNPSF